MEFIRGIDIIKEDFELPYRLSTAIFNILFTRLAHGWYIKIRQAHGHQSFTWWKTQILKKWANDAWRFKVETAFESSKFNADKDRSLPWTTEQSSEEDIINILEILTTRTRIGSSRVNLKTKFNTTWNDSVDKNPEENSNNMKYKSADIIRKCRILQSSTHSANPCPRKGKINEIYIEKEPHFEKDGEVIEENSNDKSSIFFESSKDIENISSTFELMESYSHLPQLSNGQLDLSNIQDSCLMKTKPNSGKDFTAGNSCIREMVIDKKPTKLFLDPGTFCSCVGKSFLKNGLTNFEDQFFPVDGIKFNSANKESLGAIVGHEVDIILNIERPYQPLLRRPAYPVSPKSREALEVHITDLLDLDVRKKVGHNKEVEITTPVKVACHNGKSRMVEDLKAQNTYTVQDRYPIPKIQIALTQISQAVYIRSTDALKGFHQNVLTPRARKYLRIVVHCGVYEYLIQKDG
ncbi:hypothetical protein O181_083196 [Austropuccinia psidii MF-1]|uniref:Reverse transcriptase domain-containing protein n=1 Tax=Austropuccinia psidii MF-1 TaxID=1389203 RepID=A0A9Q3FNK8_9BASI|nr:hypothetical protein [Austropuccinia psidii MF-1]